MASWTRFWCVLGEGQLRFWRYPEDETTKAPVVSIDLRTCACNEIKAIPVENCPYPNSMQVDVWVPSEKHCGKRDKIRLNSEAYSFCFFHFFSVAGSIF
uniref:PH domain-containing protein n=1 Tax=Parascaris equorum TaxID=6256 RepID=A0A914RDA2_PAREQ